MFWSCEEGGVLRVVDKMEVQGKRKVGRLKKAWNDIVQQDLKILGVDENMALDRKRWRKITASLTPINRENMDSSKNDDNVVNKTV